MIKLNMETYDIYLGLHEINQLQKYIKNIYTQKDIFIVTDEHVDQLYHNLMTSKLNDFKLHFVVIKPGETSKSIETYVQTIHHLIDLGIKRNHLLISLGGGVVGDLTGFIASTLYRGIDFIQIPTTLLSQVDSSIGSKVGIDLEKGKNLVGAFYQPKFVLIDPIFLETLDDREYYQGVAEMIKAGLIANEALYQYFKTHQKVTEKEILMALEVKRDVALKDPFDHKERMTLNFGHTFGHAIEKKYQYQTYKHGEAISYGMLIAIKIGIEKGITPSYIYDDVKKVLEKHQLIKRPYFNADELKEFIKTDKKHMADVFHFICLKDIGESVITNLKVGEIK